MKGLAGRSSEVHDMAMLALYAGLRFGEIAKLTWENVDIFQGVMKLRQTKNGKDRIAYMTPDIQKICHLKKGNPCYVAIWREHKGKIRFVEVTYAGTHEKAPY